MAGRSLSCYNEVMKNKWQGGFIIILIILIGFSLLKIKEKNNDNLFVSLASDKGEVLIIDYPKPGDAIIEIGPGLGAITELLLQAGAHVTAIEQDGRFVEILKGELADDYKNLHLVHADILKVNLNKYARTGQKFKVVGNIRDR